MDELDELDLYILSELESLKKEVISNYKIFEYQKVFSAIFNFCTNDLSSFYFDVRKDTLYCDSKNNKVRKSTRTVLDILFHDLLSLLAPILCFTTEEAWQSRFGIENSIHEKDFPKLNDTLINKNLSTKWAVYKKLRKVINGAIEVKRKEKVLGSSLEASVKLYISKDEIEKIDQKVLENISIISELEIVNDKPPSDSFISEFDKNFQLIRNINSKEIDISNKKWSIKNATTLNKNNEIKENIDLFINSKFDLEKFYDNRLAKDLLWKKSCEAIGQEFVI